MPCITELRLLFYPAGVKKVPHNIYELLTPIALAHWIKGDGSVQRHGLIICTNSYSLEDVVRLMNVLMIRYRLECNLRLKRQTAGKIEYLIYIRQDSMPLLRTIVTPYFHPSMLYKPPGFRNKPPPPDFILKLAEVKVLQQVGYPNQIFKLFYSAAQCLHWAPLRLRSRRSSVVGIN
jgi:hypothetical protein